MSDRTKRARIGQNRKSKAAPPGVAAGKGNGWGGRRHRLTGDGQNVRLTVTLTQCDMDLLESMRAKLGGFVTGLVAETVTGGAGQGVADGQEGHGLEPGQAGAGSGGSAGLGGAGSNRSSGGVDGIRMGGKVSQAAVVRRALRLLALMEGG